MLPKAILNTWYQKLVTSMKNVSERELASRQSNNSFAARLRNMKETEIIHVKQRIEREKSLIKEMSQVTTIDININSKKSFRA